MASETVELALLRGAFDHLRRFCEGRIRPGSMHNCSSCPLIGLCGDYLEDWVSLAHFAKEANRHILETHLEEMKCRK